LCHEGNLGDGAWEGSTLKRVEVVKKFTFWRRNTHVDDTTIGCFGYIDDPIGGRHAIFVKIQNDKGGGEG
jgi:hypothetical protein